LEPVQILALWRLPSGLISHWRVATLIMTRNTSRPARKQRAATRDVLAQPKRQKPIGPKWRKYFDRLVEFRDYLLRQRSDLTQAALEEQPQFATHMADAGTDHFDRDFALGMLSSEQDAMYEIEEALNRIREGTYGVCELTGRRIPQARLEAIPWTRFTAEAEKELEKDGALRRARLGPRETVARTEATAEDEE
jgi:RNA polymerase-binding transcription factor DksA